MAFLQTGTILIPDGVTTILNLMTGMGLLGVAAVASAVFPFNIILQHFNSLSLIFR